MTAQTDQLRQTSARWYMRIRDVEPDSPVIGQFETWLVSDPSHGDAYKLVEETMQDFSSTERVIKLSDALAIKNAEKKSQKKSKLTKICSTTAMLLLCAGLSFLGYRQYSYWPSSPVMQESQHTSLAYTKAKHKIKAHQVKRIDNGLNPDGTRLCGLVPCFPSFN